MVTNVPVSPTPAHQKHAHIRRVLLVGLFICILLTVVIYAIDIALSDGFGWNTAFPKSGTQIEFTNTGMPELYSFEHLSRIYTEPSLAAFSKAPVKVLEAVPYPHTAGAYVVLAQVTGQSGDVLGILTKENTFTSLIEDGTSKSDLAVDSDGYALYTVAEAWPDVSTASSTDYYTKAIVINPSAPTTDAQVAAEATKLGLGPSTTLNHPSAPVLAPVLSPTNAASRLKLVDLHLQIPKAIDLGIGRSSRLAPDGSFIALTPDGLVRIDPATDAVTTILPRMNAIQSGSEISPDGTTVALPGGRGTQFFRVIQTSPSDIILLATVPLPLVPMSFVDDTHVVFLLTDTSAFIYAVPTSTAKLANTVQMINPLGTLRLVTEHPFFTL